MTKQQAIAAMREGKKVTHPFFYPDKWITMRGYMIVTEEGFETPEHEFWKYRTDPAFDTDWHIFYEQEPEHIDLV